MVTIGDGREYQFKLYLGMASEGYEHIVVSLEGITRIYPEWASARAGFRIDGVQYGRPRPIQFYTEPCDRISGVAHFPLMSGDNNPMFSGIHTLLLRVP
jgi:hypothetical protein